MPDEFDPSDETSRLERPPAFFPYGGDGVEGDDRTLIEVQVEGVYARSSNSTESNVVVLTDGARRLDIKIGPDTAFAIVLQLDGQRLDRPVTHDLVKTLLDRLGAEVKAVHIDDLWNLTYYAKLIVRAAGGSEDVEIDARPSDAIAIALRFAAPIFVADRLFELGE